MHRHKRREKPVCGSCKIHCFGKGYKEKAKEIMAFSGPRLILKHPYLSFRHLVALFRTAPDKPTAAKPRPTVAKKEK
uniref:nitrous oxide-stimulated promoter family protein n=1 Tax=Turicimonas muris TaxID=1796652 RepID=UPI00402A9FBB